MTILIDNRSGVPIYDQIFTQIKSQILSGALSENEALPSIRSLAKDLRISVITTKRAYEELEQAGLIYTLPGRGCFVARQNPELHREEALRKMEEHLQNAIDAARGGGITSAELQESLRILLEGEKYD